MNISHLAGNRAALDPLAGGGSYTGPLDLVPGADWIFAGSMARALSAAMLNTVGYTVTRDSDDTTINATYDAVTGDVDSAAINTFIGATFNKTGAIEADSSQVVLTDATGVENGQIVTGTGIPSDTYVGDTSGAPTIWLSNPATATNAAVTLTFQPAGRIAPLQDQSGENNDAAVITGVDTPLWARNQASGHPAMRFEPNAMLDGGERALGTFGNVTIPDGKCTFFAVVKGVASIFLFGENFNDFKNCGEALVATDGSIALALIDDDENAADISGSTATDVTSAYVLIDVAWQFGTYSVRINGALKSVTPNESGAAPLGSFANRLGIGVADVLNPGSYASNGWLVELLIATNVISDADRLAIRQNIATKYDITLS